MNIDGSVIALCVSHALIEDWLLQVTLVRVFVVLKLRSALSSTCFNISKKNAGDTTFIH